MKKIDKWRNANFANVRERWMEMALYINPKFEQAKINLHLIIKIQKQK